MFLLKNYFKIFKNKITSNKDISEYEKWFRRNCDNNNDVSKNSITNTILYLYPRINSLKNSIQEMPYDEWFNRHCEKNENLIKKQKLENKKNNLIKKLLENIINNENQGAENLNTELNKFNNYEKKDIIQNLRNSIKNNLEKEKVENVIDEFHKKQKENEKARLIKSVKDAETKNQIENLINLWDNDDDYMDNLLLDEMEKQDKFNNINNLFNEKKNNELIKELNSLDQNRKKEAINYLKENNPSEIDKIDEINDLSDKQKKIDVLVSILGGRKEKKVDKKEKLKKIVDILLGLDKKTKKDCVNYMRNTIQDDEKKNDELLNIINELPSEERGEYDNFDIDENNYSYSDSNSLGNYLGNTSRINTDEIKDINIFNTAFINEDTEDFKLLDDDIFDIVNEIQNTEENPKKKLGEDEFQDVADNMINCLYNKNNEEENDFSENDEELKVIINSLNKMNQEDRMKTVGLLKENADDDTKKKKFSKFANKMKAIVKAKKIFKNIINKQKEEEERLDNIADNFLDELESQDTIYIKESDTEDEKKNNVVNLIQNLDSDEQRKVYQKVKNNAKSQEQKDKIFNLFKSMKYINKMKKFKNEVQKKLSNSEKFISGDKMSKNEIIESLTKEELKGIIDDFERDLFEENENPLTRKEARENEEKNNEKLKEISKVIDSLNIRDQETIMNTLKLKANDDYKKSQFNKLNKLIKNYNNVKLFFEKLRKKKEMKNSKNDETTKILSHEELVEMMNNFVVNIFQNNEDNNDKNSDKFAYNDEKKLEKAAEVINSLNPNQQKEILNGLQTQADSNQNQEKFKKLTKKIVELNKIKKLAKSIVKNKAILKENEIIKEVGENKNDNNKGKSNIELNEKELKNLAEAVLRNFFYKIKEKDKKGVLKETDKYILKNKKEKKLEKAAQILNFLNDQDKNKISGILDFVLKDKEQLQYLKKLNKKIGVKDTEKDNFNDLNIIEDYKNDDNIDELDDDKLAEITEKIMTDLMQDYNTQDYTERTDKLNKAANTIIILNNKDQEKILDALDNLTKNEKQKQIIEKLNKLVDNLNYMQFYLFSVNQKHLSKSTNVNKKESNETELSNIKKSVISQIFNEEDEINYELNQKKKNIGKAALRMSVLNNKDQNKILNDLIQKANEYDNNRQIRDSITKLNQTLKSIEIVKRFSNILKNKSKSVNKKKQLNDNEIKKLADNINNFLIDKKSPSNFTEELLISKHKEGKINQLAKSINVFDEISKKKALNYLTKSVINDNHQKNINRLKDSIINNKSSKNVSNIFTSQFYMISSLGSIELNEDELNLLIDTFCKDLFNDKITDMEQKEDNLNLLANVIKELHEENQNKVMQKLENKPEAKDKQDLIDDLRDRILKLKLLKDELKDEKFDNSLMDHNKTIDFENKNEDDLLENNEDNEETVVVEITMNDIGQEDLKDICDVFLIDCEDNDQNNEKENQNEKEKEKDKEREKKKKKNITKSVRFLASSLVKMDDKAQKKITDNLEKNVRNENEKLQLKELMDKVYELNLIKKIGKEIKQKNKPKKVSFKDEVQNNEELNDNTPKNLEKEELNKLGDELINQLYSDTNVDFNKNDEIKKYLIKAQNNEKIKNVAEKINTLSTDDKLTILEKLEKKSDNDEKTHKYNKLCKIINNYEKAKELKNKIKDKENQILSSDILKSNSNTQELGKDNLGILAQNCAKSLFESDPEKNQQDEIVNEIANKVKDLQHNNQEFIIKNLKEKADNEEKKDSVNKLAKLIDKLAKLKNLVNLVRKKHLNKMALQKIKDENKYGIVILPNDKKEDKQGTLVMSKPTELREDEFNQMISIFIEDLKKLNEEEIDLRSSSIDRYLKDKECEKKLEEIANVINTLDDNDKTKISEELKKSFDNGKSNNIYYRLMKMISKKERQFDNEKRKKLKEVIKDLENKDNKDILLYSFKEGNNGCDNHINADIENNSREIIIDDNEKEKNKWTFKKGSLETEEIY